MQFEPRKPFHDLRVVAALMKDGVHSYGMTEGSLRDATGLDDQELLKVVHDLLGDRVVTSFVSQEGTAGPFAHRYRLASQPIIVATFSDPPK